MKLMTSLDHQIAVGTSSGQVEIYLVPAKRPGQSNKELKKFVVDGGHRSNVTCAEWSANGMKLFTGDSIGNVVYTGVDFYEVRSIAPLSSLLRFRARILHWTAGLRAVVLVSGR